MGFYNAAVAETQKHSYKGYPIVASHHQMMLLGYIPSNELRFALGEFPMPYFPKKQIEIMSPSSCTVLARLPYH